MYVVSPVIVIEIRHESVGPSSRFVLPRTVVWECKRHINRFISAYLLITIRRAAKTEPGCEKTRTAYGPANSARNVPRESEKF